MTTWGINLNADVEVALFGEGRERKIHAIAMVGYATWIRLIKKSVSDEERKMRTAFVEKHGKTITTVCFFEVSSKMTSAL